MGKVSRAGASEHLEAAGYVGDLGEIDGYTVAFETYTEDADLSPFFAGLPNDHCQCPHWGTVLKGKLRYTYEDGSVDEIAAGEAYYARPGHLPMLFAGTEVVEFSPTVDLHKTIEVVNRNVQAAMAAG
jgi:hypothetical protein